VNDSHLFDPGPTTADPYEGLSATQKVTQRNKDQIAAGRHPATLLPLLPDECCGQCVHAHHYNHHNRSYWKCGEHRLGESHSAASDIRVSWPACTKFEASR